MPGSNFNDVIVLAMKQVSAHDDANTTGLPACCSVYLRPGWRLYAGSSAGGEVLVVVGLMALLLGAAGGAAAAKSYRSASSNIKESCSVLP